MTRCLRLLPGRRRGVCLSQRKSTVLSLPTAPAAPNNNSSASFSFSSLLSWYSSKLDSHPLLTKAITSGIIAGAGDGLCQCMTKRQDDSWNWNRTGRFALVGFAYAAPVRHYFLNALDKYCAGGSWSRVIQRVLWERGVLAPASLAVWLTTMWTLEHHWTHEQPEWSPFTDPERYWKQLKQTYPGLLLTSWTLWTPLMAVNFRWVPLKYQVLYINVFTLLWNAYLSWHSTQHHHSPGSKYHLDEEVETHGWVWSEALIRDAPHEDDTKDVFSNQSVDPNHVI